MSILFGKRRAPPPVKPIDPSEDARELRRRVTERGGHQSTLLAGKKKKSKKKLGDNVFKRQAP